MKLFIGVPFLLVGIGITIAGFFNYQKTNNFLATAQTVNAQVVKYDSHISTSRRKRRTTRTIMYTPLFAYQINGEDFVTKSKSSSSSKPYQIGEKVDIFYNAENPNEIRQNTFFDLWGLSLIFSIMGTIFTLAGLGITTLIIKKMKKKSIINESEQNENISRAA